MEGFFKYWGDAVEYGDPITNMEIIALLAIHLNSGNSVPKRLVKAATDALNRELVEEELSSWSEPDKRKEVLLQLLATIGGKVKPPKPPESFRHPALQFKNTREARAGLLKLGRIAVSRRYGLFPQMLTDESAPVPPFLRTLNRLMNHGAWDANIDIYEQMMQERKMMLIWYLWLTTRAWKDEDLKELGEMLDLPARSQKELDARHNPKR